MKKILFLLTLLCQSAWADGDYVVGNITKITSIPEGLLIKLEPNNLPTVCNGHAAYGWFIIPEKRKTILSLTLILWSQKKLSVGLYVDNDQGNNTFCTVSQIEPIQ